MYVIEGAVLSNSITVSVGDVVIINTSSPQFVTVNGSGTGIILGTVLGIKNGPAGGSVYLQEGTVTTASNNQTVGLVSVDILATADGTTMLATLSAAAGTTTNSQYFGYFNVKASTTPTVLDESTYSASSEKQFLSYGLATGSTTQVVGVFTKIAQA